MSERTTKSLSYRAPFGPNIPDFVQVLFNNKAALEAAVDDTTAALIFETLPATYGMPIPHQDFYAFALECAHRHSALLITDEVQTGLGRTGKFWGIEHFDVIPDILVTGKGLSGGIYPMSATCFGPELETVFKKDPFIHVSTFGGAEVGCPVAMRVLEISSRPAVLKHVRDLAEIFRKGFEELKEKHPEILVDLRQLGLMMGIEMVNEDCGPTMSKILYDHGLLSVYANNDVMNCYYDVRSNFTDLAANLYKEQRPDLIPLALTLINRLLDDGKRALTLKELNTYYRTDKLIWTLFLTLRKLDRWIKVNLFRQRYEFILPGKIKR